MNKPVNFDPERFILIPHQKGSYESQFSYDDLSDSQKKVFVELMDPFSGSIPYPREFAIDMAKTFSSSEIKKAKRIQKKEDEDVGWADKQMNEGVPSYVATTNFEIDETKETYFGRQMNENGYESNDPMSVLEFGRNYKSTWKQSAGKWFSDLGSAGRKSTGGRDMGGRDMGGRDMGGRDMGGRDMGGRDTGR